jgi:RND family efflux transporter MFP subunit
MQRLHRLAQAFWLALSLLAPVLAYTQPPATPVGVDAVNTVPMSQTVPVIGRFVSPQSGAVAARAPGPVAKLRVSVGDHVEQDEILVELDRSRLRAALELQNAQIAELKASQKTAQATAKLAVQELERIQKLRNTAAFARYDFDRRVQELAVARARVEEAQARLSRGEVARDLAALELSDSEIRAPYPGIVIQRHISEGAWLRVGDPVVTLINDADLEIEADVPATRLAGLKPGTEVSVILEQSGQNENTQFSATVRALIPDENPAARTRPVRFRPDSQLLQQTLAVNQDITLLLPASGSEHVLTVAKDAVLRRGLQALVFVVADGKAQPRPVQLGEAIGDRFQVLDGLADGEIVVIRGNERLRPGQAVVYPNMPHAESTDGSAS